MKKKRRIRKHYRAMVYTIQALFVADLCLALILGLMNLNRFTIKGRLEREKHRVAIHMVTGNANLIITDVYAEDLPSAKDAVRGMIYLNEPQAVITINDSEISAEGGPEQVSEAEAEETVYHTEYGDFSQEEMELLWAVVMQEGGPSYSSANAVMSTVINRLNDSRWAWCGDTVMDQITHPWQYCYSIDDYWRKYLGGNVNDSVKEAVLDTLNGKLAHNYTCFRGYEVSGAEQIGDNWYWYGY